MIMPFDVSNVLETILAFAGSMLIGALIVVGVFVVFMLIAMSIELGIDALKELPGWKGPVNKLIVVFEKVFLVCFIFIVLVFCVAAFAPLGAMVLKSVGVQLPPSLEKIIEAETK